MSEDAREALAKKRYYTLSGLRLAGALILVLGLAVLGNGLWGLPRAAGFALMLIGIIEFLIVPVMLAKRWKSKPDE